MDRITVAPPQCGVCGRPIGVYERFVLEHGDGLLEVVYWRGLRQAPQSLGQVRRALHVECVPEAA